jgi:uncharacterized membrane protein
MLFTIPHELLYVAAISFTFGFVIATIFDTSKNIGFIKAFIYGEVISGIFVSCVYFLIIHMNEIVSLFTTNVKVV